MVFYNQTSVYGIKSQKINLMYLILTVPVFSTSLLKGRVLQRYGLLCSYIQLCFLLLLGIVIYLLSVCFVYIHFLHFVFTGLGC